MREEFILPIAEVIHFENEDVITDSNPQIPGETGRLSDEDFSDMFD